MIKKLSVLGMTLGLAFASCGEDKDEEKNGAPIGAPEIAPPVERNTPDGFSNPSLTLEEESENNTPEKRLIAAIQTYLNPTAADAVGALQRLTAIDERIKSLDSRATSAPQRLCLLEDPKAYTLAAALPGDNTFAMSFQCQENLDNGTGTAESLQIAFGMTENDFFLFERAGAHDNAVLAKSSKDGSSTEFWQLGSNEGSSFIHLMASDASGMEFTSASSQTGDGLACGVHMKANDTYVYATGFDSVAGECGTTEVIVCLSATDLTSTEASNCTDANLDDFSLDTLSVAQAQAAAENAESIIKSPIYGYIDFTKGEEETPPVE